LLNTILALCLALSQTGLPEAVVRVDPDRVVNRVSPWMYGSCIEDVNHEIYGGLYAQMIFGESFEEPPPAVSPLAGWSLFGGRWSVEGGACHVEPDAGAKLVRDTPQFADGVVECEVRLDDDRGDNSGLILRVRDPRTGADSWIGYEVSISARSHSVILGRHQNDWKPLRSAPASVRAGEWHRLRVALDGPLLRVWLDDDPAPRPRIEFRDASEPLAAGSVGIRTWNSRASFRNLIVRTGGREVTDALSRPAAAPAMDAVSGMWTGYRTGAAAGHFGWEADDPFNSLHSQQIAHAGGSGTVGIFNLGLNRWGLSVRAGARYAGRLYVRRHAGDSGQAAGLTVALQSRDGTVTYARASLKPAGRSWERRAFSLISNADDPHARFAIFLERPGAAVVDQVALMPTGRDLFHGLPVRADIGNAMQSEGLTFLRYGGSMVNAPGYRWKSMVGDPDRRPQYAGTWYPCSINGFGIEEFVRFCESAHIEPAFAINIEETTQDAADLVSYLNGPVSSEWGRRRAQNGHSAPYGVKFIEIGNEEATNEHYLERFKALEAAIRHADPALQLVIGAWWEPDNPVSRRIVEQLEGKAALWDVHVGGDSLNDGRAVDALFTRMERLVRQWAPGTALKACVFEENGGRHDLQRALGHALILNATERHGDFVVMDCPANCLQPLGQNDNGWDQGQIFFTSDRVWGMPPYYAEQMAARNHLLLRVQSSVEGAADLDVTATRSEDGRTLALKVVNAGARPVAAALRLGAFSRPATTGQVWTISGDLTGVNDAAHPEAICWKQSPVRLGVETAPVVFPAASYTILRLRRVGRSPAR